MDRDIHMFRCSKEECIDEHIRLIRPSEFNMCSTSIMKDTYSCGVEPIFSMYTERKIRQIGEE